MKLNRDCFIKIVDIIYIVFILIWLFIIFGFIKFLFNCCNINRNVMIYIVFCGLYNIVMVIGGIVLIKGLK